MTQPLFVRAFTLPEMLLAMGVAGLVAAGVASVFLFYSRSAATITAAVAVNQADQLALEHLNKDVRQAEQARLLAATNLLLVSGTNAMSYQYDPRDHHLYRVANGSRQALLHSCSWFNFQLGHRHVSTDYESLCTCTSLPNRIVVATWVSVVQSNPPPALWVTNRAVYKSRFR